MTKHKLRELEDPASKDTDIFVTQKPQKVVGISDVRKAKGENAN